MSFSADFLSRMRSECGENICYNAWAIYVIGYFRARAA